MATLAVEPFQWPGDALLTIQGGIDEDGKRCK